jgi:hypothetical protein
MEDKVHDLVTFITAWLGVATIVVFLFLIDYAARLLRPVSILARVAEGGLQVIRRGLSRSGRSRCGRILGARWCAGRADAGRCPYGPL